MPANPVALTQNQALLDLMCNEFHDEDGKFDAREPKAFLTRLSDDQHTLLENTANQQLVAFINAGDGYVERSMGIDMVYELVNAHLARPTASFALFYKSEQGEVELAFYTRYFLISYSTIQTAHVELRRIFDDLQASEFDAEMPDYDALKRYQIDDAGTRAAMLEDAYTWCMEQHYLYGRRAYDVSGFINARGRAPSYYLSVDHRFKHDLDIGYLDAAGDPAQEEYYFAYCFLHELKANGALSSPKWFGGNAIHGLYNTKGCWSILRNYHWHWPKENAGVELVETNTDGSTRHGTHFVKGDERPLYEILADIYITHRYADTKCPESGPVTYPQWYEMLWHYYDFAESPLATRGDIDHLLLKKIYYDFVSGTGHSINHSYRRFLNLFTGIPFTARQERVGLPRGDVASGESNCYQKTYRPEFADNTFGKRFDSNQGWAQLYLFRAKHSGTGGFTPDYNDEHDGARFINVAEDP